MTERFYYTETDWPHGLRCPICDRVMVEGDEYRQQLQSMFDDGTPVLLIVCAGCEDAGRAHVGEGEER
jgi:hypothetical protein